MTKRKAMAAESFQDDKYYEIDLIRAVEYPPGSGRLMPPGAKITMKGKAAKTIAGDILDAREKS